MINSELYLGCSYGYPLGSSHALHASGYVGRKVMFVRDAIKLDRNKASSLFIQIPAEVYQIKLFVFNQSRKLIRTIFLGKRAFSLFEFVWDGLNDEGKRMKSGYYYLKATCLCAGSELNLSTMVQANVNGVNISKTDDNVFLNVAEVGEVQLEDVLYFIHT